MDRAFIQTCGKAPFLQLVCALQVKTVRFQGICLKALLTVPESVVRLLLDNWRKTSRAFYLRSFAYPLSRQTALINRSLLLYPVNVNQQNITVCVICRFPLEQAGLEALLARLPGLKIVRFGTSDPPQVLIFDYGNSVTSDLPERTPLTALLLLVAGDECPELPPEANKGVLGLFSKNETAEALSIAIRQLSRGEAYLTPALALSVLQQKQSREVVPEFESGTLTEREREVLELLAEGLSNKAIAARLYLSVRTVDGHLTNLYTRLGVRSRTEAMRLAVEHKLVSRNR